MFIFVYFSLDVIFPFQALLKGSQRVVSGNALADRRDVLFGVVFVHVLPLLFVSILLVSESEVLLFGAFVAQH